MTAVLVSAPPARTQHTQRSLHRDELQSGPYVATGGVAPARVGFNTVRIAFAHAEVPVDVHVSSTLPRRNIGPLLAMLEHESPDVCQPQGAVPDRRCVDAADPGAAHTVRAVHRRRHRPDRAGTLSA